MRVLSVSGFSDWQREAGIKEFVLDSDNNDDVAWGRLHVSMRFPCAVVSRASNRIAFKCDAGCLYFDHVKEVDLHDEFDCVGTVFDIICKLPGNGEISWRFIAD